MHPSHPIDTAPLGELRLIPIGIDHAGEAEAYRAEFPPSRERVTFVPERIPGLDRLEEFPSAADWLRSVESERGRIERFMLVRGASPRALGFCTLRRKLEYDDDDPEFASHIGYSVRPSERGRGYGRELLRLALEKARELGLEKLRLVCVDTNTASIRVITANGGRPITPVYGAESGLTVNRYDIELYPERKEENE